MPLAGDIKLPPTKEATTYQSHQMLLARRQLTIQQLESPFHYLRTEISQLRFLHCFPQPPQIRKQISNPITQIWGAIPWPPQRYQPPEMTPWPGLTQPHPQLGFASCSVSKAQINPLEYASEAAWWAVNFYNYTSYLVLSASPLQHELTLHQHMLAGLKQIHALLLSQDRYGFTESINITVNAQNMGVQVQPV